MHVHARHATLEVHLVPPDQRDLRAHRPRTRIELHPFDVECVLVRAEVELTVDEKRVAGAHVAVLVDLDGGGWVSAIRNAVDSPEWVAPLIKAGYEQEKRFSWKQTADRMVALIDAATRLEPL